MLRRAILRHANGKDLGTKSVPEDCYAVKYGGSTFVMAGVETVEGEPPRAVYQMTNTYHFNDLD